MTDAVGASAPDNARSGGLEGFVDELVRCWKQATRASRGILDGTYTLTDAASDFDDWLTSSTNYAVRVADDLWGDAPPLVAPATAWTATMTVGRRADDRPLTLKATGLRAIGAPIEIPPSAVTFEPPVLQLRDDTFEIRVAMAGVPTEKTLIFEGIVNAEESHGPVTDPVRVNNRDGGPVR